MNFYDPFWLDVSSLFFGAKNYVEKYIAKYMRSTFDVAI